jgi:hypothetical protein
MVTLFLKGGPQGPAPTVEVAGLEPTHYNESRPASRLPWLDRITPDCDIFHHDMNMQIDKKNKNNFDDRLQLVINYSVIITALIGLYFTTWVNYLLFHSMAEIFTIVVAFSIFVIAWNSKKYIRNPYLLFVGIAYLFIAFLDLLHTLSYKGMPIFTDYDYYANQLWIGARYMESITLLVAFIFLRGDKMPKANLVFAVYAGLTGLLVASIFYWKTFPVCFVDGIGLTPFKKISEYVICGILFAAILLLQKNRARFEKRIFQLLLWSIICTIVSELCFTNYTSNYGFANMLGHYFKIFSFFLIYKAIITTGIEKPFNLIFLDLDKANKDLKKEIEVRLQIQKEKEKLIDSLKQAVEEIKTLQGMLPICSICKNIRDDQGYWNGIESYFSKHSELVFSHGLCPDCAQKHYPEFYKQKG